MEVVCNAVYINEMVGLIFKALIISLFVWVTRFSPRLGLGGP